MSLIEALIATGVLATGVAALMQLFVVSARANVEAREATYAAVLAARKIEELRAAPFPGPAASADLVDARGVLLEGARSRREALFERRWTVAPLPAQAGHTVVMTVVVSRRGAPEGRAVRLTTVRTRRDGGLGRRSAEREGGFTIIELLVASAITLLVAASAFRLIDPARAAFQAQPEISDMHQRVRSAVDTLARDLRTAGARVAPTAAPPLVPYRIGQTRRDAAAGIYYRSDALSIIVAPRQDLGLASRTYYLRTDASSGVPQLMLYDGLQTDAPVVDHVVAVGFEYFDAGETPLDPAVLQDGPWVPADPLVAEFDADLLRIRRVRVRLRVEAALAAMRAGSGPLFARAGTATAAARYLPDLALQFDVALRNARATW